jgi:hypothetical protein
MWIKMRHSAEARKNAQRTNIAVADIRGRRSYRRPFFKKFFSIFPSKDHQKIISYYLGWALKSSFCLRLLPSSKILDQPLEYSTLILTHLHFQSRQVFSLKRYSSWQTAGRYHMSFSSQPVRNIARKVKFTVYIQKQ